MMSLFTSFDLKIMLSMSPIYFFCLFLIFSPYVKLNHFNSFISTVIIYLQEFFCSINPKNMTKFGFFILSLLFFMIFFFNFFSVFSYNFALGSQLSVILFTSSCIWIALMTFYSINNIKGMLSHCVPEGTPIYLVPFLFLIEIVSNVIRPITLTVRLVANILAGHLLMILLSKMVMSSFFFSVFYTILNSVEIFVALIQAYIFVTMLILYLSELK